MKKTCLSILSLLSFVLLFNACSTDVDLYADYKDITVVYGLLDSDKDTNYVKINKAFLGPGNALEIALIADSCNYPYKLDAKINEYRASVGSNDYQKTRTLQLDTITIHNKDQEGFFYAPDQLVYYTAEKIYSNSDKYKYRYELLIDRGDTIISAVTDMVGGYGFNIITSAMSFAGEMGSQIKWRPCPNAAVYEVVLKFRFTEVGALQDSTEHCMSWSLGTHSETSLEMDNDNYLLSHKSSVFYYELSKYLGKYCDTTDVSIDRIVMSNPVCVSIAAGGEELYNFISVNGPSSSIVQSIPEYTNVKGGYGVFSSRTMNEKWIRFSSIQDLAKYENWRFRQG